MINSKDTESQVTSFQHISDEELCAKTAQGDSQAETELVCRYGRLVRVCARPLFLRGGTART